jgi:fructokinase
VRIGIDLGGTKIEGIAIDDDGREAARKRIAAPRGDYRRTLDAIVQMVADIERASGATGMQGSVGVGIPGTISPATGLVKNANSTWMNGQPLADDLPRLLDRPVRFANDANCFALSEATDGAAAGASIVFGVIIGTGTGGGVAVDGRVLTGANAIAGEWGHNPLPAPRDDERPGPACYCGRSGCIETFLAGPGLSRDYVDHARLEASRYEAARPFQGRDVTAEEIADRARSGEARAVACLARYEDRIARALASIVLGGGLSNIDHLYGAVPTLWAPHVFSDRVATTLVRAKHGDASGVRGAAWLWEREK